MHLVETLPRILVLHRGFAVSLKSVSNLYYREFYFKYLQRYFFIEFYILFYAFIRQIDYFISIYLTYNLPNNYITYLTYNLFYSYRFHERELQFPGLTGTIPYPNNWTTTEKSPIS